MLSLLMEEAGGTKGHELGTWHKIHGMPTGSAAPQMLQESFTEQRQAHSSCPWWVCGRWGHSTYFKGHTGWHLMVYERLQNITKLFHMDSIIWFSPTTGVNLVKDTKAQRNSYQLWLVLKNCCDNTMCSLWNGKCPSAPLNHLTENMWIYVPFSTYSGDSCLKACTRHTVHMFPGNGGIS